MKKFTRAQFEKPLYAWYAQYGRDLPWRKTKDPYAIWVAEIMLQQTQVERVKAFYKKFLEKFPTVYSLADASWEEVLEYWRGLGYYRRARNLHKAAQVVVEKYNGKFPDDFKALQELPGIGTYTAAAIASFAFGQDVPALDTNLHKVFRHVVGVEEWPCLKPAEQFAFAQNLISKGKGAQFNHALMDVAASGVLDNVLQHELCPFKSFCHGVMQPAKLIVRDQARLKNENVIKVAAGVVIHQGKVLICKRPLHKPLGGLWEFPGGKLEANEDERKCLKRELMEELGIEVSVRPHFFKTMTQHKGQQILISFHRCSLLLGETKALEVDEFLWVTPPQLFDFKFLKANEEVMRILHKKKAMFLS